MHQWHDSSVVEWCSTPSLICYLLWPLLLWFVCRGVWMHPRSDLFSGFNYYMIICICIWWLELVCNTLLSHIWELATPPIEDTPHLSDYLRGLPSIWLWRYMVTYGYDMIWYVSGLGRITVLYLLPLLNLYLYIIPILHLLILNQCNIFCLSFLFHITLLLYLFTGLFKLSRVFFLPRQVLEGSWVMGEECK